MSASLTCNTNPQVSNEKWPSRNAVKSVGSEEHVRRGEDGEEHWVSLAMFGSRRGPSVDKNSSMRFSATVLVTECHNKLANTFRRPYTIVQRKPE